MPLNKETKPNLNASQIFKLVKNFEAHGTSEDHRATGSIKEECACIINNLTHHICGNGVYLVISVDMRPYFTGIALHIISSTNTTQNFTIA